MTHLLKITSHIGVADRRAWATVRLPWRCILLRNHQPPLVPELPSYAPATPQRPALAPTAVGDDTHSPYQMVHVFSSGTTFREGRESKKMAKMEQMCGRENRTPAATGVKRSGVALAFRPPATVSSDCRGNLRFFDCVARNTARRTDMPWPAHAESPSGPGQAASLRQSVQSVRLGSVASTAH